MDIWFSDFGGSVFRFGVYGEGVSEEIHSYGFRLMLRFCFGKEVSGWNRVLGSSWASINEGLYLLSLGLL